MKISAISSYSYPKRTVKNSFKASEDNVIERLYRAEGDDYLVMSGKAAKYFEVLDPNMHNEKIGSKFIITPKDPKYKGLNILITPDTKIKSKNGDLSIEIKKESSTPSFKGTLYGSIREEADGSRDTKMEREYDRFFNTTDMYNVVKPVQPVHPINNDYNFFIPTDGDGTRYKDITKLQGDVSKPASHIPATLAGKQMSLVQVVLANYAHTTKMDKKYDLVHVPPARGSAYAFLEALKSGQLKTDKPLVYSWGDNFTDLDISRLINNHEKADSGFSLLVIPYDDKEKVKPLSIIKPASIEDRTMEAFEEKPQNDDFIESCAVKIDGKKKYLASVGPYVISAPALKWIKEKYTENPDMFFHEKKKFDFSSKVMGNLLEAFNKGEIKSESGKPLSMNFDIIAPHETWSDLGKQTDFTKALKDIKEKGSQKYMGLPSETRESLYNNIDDKGNITFNNLTKRLFNNMLSEYNLDATNAIAYCKDDNISL